MPPGNAVFSLFQIASQFGIAIEVNQPAVIREGIDDAVSLPLDCTALNVLGGNERELAVSLNIEIGVPTDKGCIRPGGHADSDLAAGFLKGRIVPFNPPEQGDPVV